MKRDIRLSILGIVACGAIGLAVCPARAASPKSDVSILVETICEPPSFLEGTGTFIATGGVNDEGPARVIVWLADQTGHVELRLNTREEGILIWAQTTFENPTPSTMYAEGPWVIIDGNGPYETLHGAGWIVIEGSFETGVFTYILDGMAVQP
jgi:hypothetical protein